MMHPVDWPTVIRGIELRHHTPPIRVRWEPGFLLFEFTVLDRDTGVPIHVERAAWPAPPCYSVAEALWHVYRCLAASLDHELAEASRSAAGASTSDTNRRRLHAVDDGLRDRIGAGEPGRRQ